MNRTDFYLKHMGTLTAEDFQRSPLWAGYYEPDDFEEIVRWGIPESTAREALDRVNWEDDHYFPLPLNAANSSWMRGKLYGISATTRSGLRLSGYTGESRDYLVIFHNGKSFVLSSQTTYSINALSLSLGGGSVIPLQIENHVTGEVWDFTAV